MDSAHHSYPYVHPALEEKMSRLPDYTPPQSYSFQKRLNDAKTEHEVTLTLIEWFQKSGGYNGIGANFPDVIEKLGNIRKGFNP